MPEQRGVSSTNDALGDHVCVARLDGYRSVFSRQPLIAGRPFPAKQQNVAVAVAEQLAERHFKAEARRKLFVGGSPLV